ncbi:hypothetical protein SDC9_186222 [bioreactor metagenome]|uniref:Uncharacterized protein n=1 Tax=bioreactor metagenome TaxID=1076179 RepID=A0A645HIB1_9ZZZZ
MVDNTCHLHDNHPHIFCTFRYFHSQCFFDRHPPCHIVKRCRTVVQPVGKRRDLVKRALFRDLLEGAVNISDGGIGVQDIFAIHQQDILENTMGGRVGRSEVEDGKFFSFFKTTLPYIFLERMFGITDKNVFR